MDSFRLERDADAILTVTMDLPGQSANTLSPRFQADFIALVEQLENEQESLAGVVLASAKKSFFAGGDLEHLLACGPEEGPQLFQELEALKAAMRRLEKLRKPVVAAIGGAALGGGWELALCCHHRVCLADPKLELGLPECTLGLLPGAGGSVRMVRHLGLQGALPYLLEGKTFAPQEALALGLVQALVPLGGDPVAQAKALLRTAPAAQQPWDREGFRLPGGGPENPKTAQLISVAPAQLRAKTRGCYPAPEAALAAAVDSVRVDFETALRIESRYFVELATGQIAKNMIGTLWFGLKAVQSGARRPTGSPAWQPQKVAVLGAGMMGAGIAYACAVAGLPTVLKDVSQAQAERGKGQVQALLEKRVAKGSLAPAQRDAILALITPTATAEEMRGCDLIVEAVFEQADLKAAVLRECEPLLAEGGLLASNTSSLPITGLATAAVRPEAFIGLHFFSPVDRMQLVEIIKGARTSPDTLAKACDFVRQIGKLPIVVNDGRGFFTTRVFGTFTNEGAALLADGVPAAVIENAALQAGMAVGPLAVMDELSLNLFLHVAAEEAKDCAVAGVPYPAPSALAVLERMVTEGRPGRTGGGGFFDYPEGQPKRLWQGLAQRFPGPGDSIPFADVQDRLLYIQSLEAVRCLEAGVVASALEANVGSILGIGFPAWTGGVIQYVNSVGSARFCARAQKLAERYGARFAPPALLLAKAAREESLG